MGLTTLSTQPWTSASQLPFYGVAPSVDGSVWGSMNEFPGGIVRLSPGPNPPETALAEYFEVPWNDSRVQEKVFAPRGMDIDRNGVVWTPLSSGHLASFDRSKCLGPLNGPEATGRHCPEGWTFHREPIPQFKGVIDSGSAEASYYTWVDQFDTFGLGPNTPIRHRSGFRGVTRPEGRPVGYPSSPVSTRLLHKVDGWSHRRPERRLEGQRPVGDGRQPCPLAHGDGEVDDE